MEIGPSRGEEDITRSIAATAVREEDSNSDARGFQMVDNDSDGKLAEIPSEPEDEAEEWREIERRESSKVTIMEEQKSSGSIPQTKKAIAIDMGLYISYNA